MCSNTHKHTHTEKREANIHNAGATGSESVGSFNQHLGHETQACLFPLPEWWLSAEIYVRRAEQGRPLFRVGSKLGGNRGTEKYASRMKAFVHFGVNARKCMVRLHRDVCSFVSSG